VTRRPREPARCSQTVNSDEDTPGAVPGGSGQPRPTTTPSRPDWQDVVRLVDELDALVPAGLSVEQRRAWIAEHLPRRGAPLGPRAGGRE
jgi:hypothetical protein